MTLPGKLGCGSPFQRETPNRLRGLPAQILQMLQAHSTLEIWPLPSTSQTSDSLQFLPIGSPQHFSVYCSLWWEPLWTACPPRSTANFNLLCSIQFLPAHLTGGISQPHLLPQNLSGTFSSLPPCSITSPLPGPYSPFGSWQLEVSVSTATVLVLTTLSSQTPGPSRGMSNEWVTCSGLRSTSLTHSRQR